MIAQQEIGGREFRERVCESGRRVVVQFSVPRCGHCGAIAGAVETAAREVGADVDLYRVDVGQEPELAERFGILSTPTLVYVHDGREVGRCSGAITRNGLVGCLRRLNRRRSGAASGTGRRGRAARR